MYSLIGHTLWSLLSAVYSGYWLVWMHSVDSFSCMGLSPRASTEDLAWNFYWPGADSAKEATDATAMCEHWQTTWRRQCDGHSRAGCLRTPCCTTGGHQSHIDTTD